jgi:cytochrome b6-f complex iron-sulfur subunit
MKTIARTRTRIVRILLPLVTLLGHVSTGAVRITRRNFLRNATLGAVLVVLAELVAGALRFIWPNKTGAFGGKMTVSAANVPPVNGKPYEYAPGKFYLSRTADGVLALYWKCTHLGCKVPWVDEEHRFHCPCHGSIFLLNGVRVAGPAPRPLDLMKVTVLPGGDVEVDTGKITKRSDYAPEQAAPYPG